MTRQQAINLKCKECIYDELDQGTWRTQVENRGGPGCLYSQTRFISGSPAS